MSYSPRCKSSPFLLVAPLLQQAKIVLLLYIIHIATKPPHHLVKRGRKIGSAGLGMKSFEVF